MYGCFFTLPSDNNGYFCNGCDSKFMEEDSLKDHMAQVHSDKPYKCDYCQAAFRYKGNLASHKTVHTGTPEFLSYFSVFLLATEKSGLCPEVGRNKVPVLSFCT